MALFLACCNTLALAWCGHQSISEYSHPIIGIDFGSTNAYAGIYRNKKLEVVLHDNNTTTSFPLFAYLNLTSSSSASSSLTSMKSDFVVGSEARNYSYTHPELTISDIKHLISLLGKPWTAGLHQQVKSRFPYPIVHENGRLRVQFLPSSAERKWGVSYYVEEIAALFFAQLKANAETYLGENITQAVVTVPPNLTDAGRMAVKNAGAICGLSVLRIINEPTAACCAYDLQNQERRELNLFVFDIGARHTDVTVLMLDWGVFEILSTRRIDNDFGGKTFDQHIVQHLLSEMKKQYGGDMINISLSPLSTQLLWEAAESAKQTLSSQEEAHININLPIDNDNDKEITFSYTLTRETFLSLTHNLLETMIKPAIIKVLNESEYEVMNVSVMDRLIFSGGGSHTVGVKEFVQQVFQTSEDDSSTCNNGDNQNNQNNNNNNKKERLIVLDQLNPSEVVMIGAARQGAALAEPVAQHPYPLAMVELPIGVETSGGVMTVMVEKYTWVPFKKRMQFKTVRPQQQTASIQVYEGFRYFTKDNVHIGGFTLSNLSSLSSSSSSSSDSEIIIEITIEYVFDDKLLITATQKLLPDADDNNNDNFQDTNNDGVSIQQEMGFDLSGDVVAQMVETQEMYAELDRESQESIANGTMKLIIGDHDIIQHKVEKEEVEVEEVNGVEEAQVEAAAI